MHSSHRIDIPFPPPPGPAHKDRQFLCRSAQLALPSGAGSRGHVLLALGASTPPSEHRDLVLFASSAKDREMSGEMRAGGEAMSVRRSMRREEHITRSGPHLTEWHPILLCVLTMRAEAHLRDGGVAFRKQSGTDLCCILSLCGNRSAASATEGKIVIHFRSVFLNALQCDVFPSI
jgi:hypothetical protein